MANDFIPASDDAFNHFYDTLAAYIAEHGATLGLSAAQITAFDTAHSAWANAWNAWEAEQNTYNSLLVAKDEARAAGTVFIRQANATAQASPATTDAERETAGLPVHKKTRTPTAEINTHPVLYRVDNEHLLQRLWFSDQEHVGVKAKPKGAAFCEIRQLILAPGVAAPVDPEAMPFLATDSKSPHRTDLEAEDLGKVAYYAQRWVNKVQEPGPWGPITSYPVV